MTKAPAARDSAALVLFARLPQPGQCKTRLIPLLGAEGAANLQRALIADAVRKAHTLRGTVTSYLATAGARAYLPLTSPRGQPRLALLQQRGTDLGERLENAFSMLLRRHSRVVVMGTDSPLLPRAILFHALSEMRWCDAVLGPCPDGGYYLIGLRRQSSGSACHGLLRGIRWGSKHALGDTMRALLSAGLSVSLLDPFEDVDRPQDFRRLFNRLSGSMACRRSAPATWQCLKRLSKKTPG